MDSETKLNRDIFKKMKTKINLSSVESESPELTGEIIQNRFRITGRLRTESGEAKIYTADDLQNQNARCVVKLYLRKKSIKQGILKKLSALNEPAVARIISYGEIEGFTYTVMPYYSGISLGDFIRQGVTFSFEDLASSIIPSIVHSLNIIHSLGIVHKDLKPANVIVNEQNEENHLVLIDFGISTETNGKNLVVTDTGKTLFYAAPETMTGTFSVYSDYYSLGICIYELFTGHTPYQNTAMAEDELFRYAQIQKIPYPEGFPQRLMDLIDGLTYKDLSNRDDPDNPNRRWTYEEVQKWLKGENLPVPGRGLQTKKEQGDFVVPYFINNLKIHTNRELADYFMTNWQVGIYEVGRGLITRHYEQNGDKRRIKLCQQCETALGKAKDPAVYFYRLMYQIGNVTTLYWKDFKFDSLQAFGEKLINCAVENTDPELLQTVKIILGEGILSLYTKNCGLLNNEQNSQLEKAFNNIIELQRVESLDDRNLSLLLGYALTGRQTFRIGTDIFEDIADFNQKMQQLYDGDLPAFVEFFDKYKTELEQQKKLFSKELCQQFEQLFTVHQSVIRLSGGELFRKPADILNYLQQLWDQNQIESFYSFIKINSGLLSDYSKQFDKSDSKLYKKIRSDHTAVFNIDDRYYRDLPSFACYAKNLIEQQRKLHNGVFDKFMELHRIAITGLVRSRSDVRDVMTELTEWFEKLNGDKSTVLRRIALNAEYKSGQLVNFGSYYRDNSVQKEPLQWRILAVADDEIMLMTEFAVDCRQYNRSDALNTSWEKCKLRKWLNSEFFNTAFSVEERKLVVTNDITGKDGNTVRDSVFCLKREEATQYCEDLRCRATEFTKSKGAKDEQSGYCRWWLRQNEKDNSQIYVVDYNGNITNYAAIRSRLMQTSRVGLLSAISAVSFASSVPDSSIAVRPVCRIKI